MSGTRDTGKKESHENLFKLHSYFKEKEMSVVKKWLQI